MAFAVNIMPLVTPITARKEQGMAVLFINIAAKALNTLYITNKTDCFSFIRKRIRRKGGKVLKRIPVHSIAVAIAALYCY